MPGLIKQINREPKERDVEGYLRKQIEKRGGLAYKFTSPNHKSVPDRMCVFPNGMIIFVECKRPGNDVTELQAYEIKRLRNLGQDVRIIDTKQKVDTFISALERQGAFLK